jgi:hypothetical protein
MYTAHAQTRCQQRCISSEVVDALLSYGERRRHQGADVYYLTKQARSRLSSAVGERYRRYEKALNSYVVMSDDGQVITAGRRYRRLKF